MAASPEFYGSLKIIAAPKDVKDRKDTKDNGS
jgi:hypothetical protein